MSIFEATVALLLLLYHWNIVVCRTETCKKLISIHCESPHQISITAVNTTSNLVESLLKECNAHNECHVQNYNKECVRVDYWCGTYGDIHQVKMSSSLLFKTNKSLMSLTSKNYENGEDQEAQNVICNLTLDGPLQVPRKLTMTVYELAPFIRSPNFCLSVNSMIAVCSASGRFYKTYGPFFGSASWQFSMKLSGYVTPVPKIRFWIDMSVYPSDAEAYELRCDSQPVPSVTSTVASTLISTSEAWQSVSKVQQEFLGTTTEFDGDSGKTGQTFNLYIPVIVVLCALSAILALSRIWTILKRTSNSPRQTEQLADQLAESSSVISGEDQPIYCEMDDIIRPPPLPPMRSRSVNLLESKPTIPEYLQVLPSLPPRNDGLLMRSAPNLLEHSNQQMAAHISEEEYLDPSGANTLPAYVTDSEHPGNIPVTGFFDSEGQGIKKCTSTDAIQQEYMKTLEFVPHKKQLYMPMLLSFQGKSKLQRGNPRCTSLPNKAKGDGELIVGPTTLCHTW